MGLVLALALMLPGNFNPWASDNWGPLREYYAYCQATSPTSLHYYVCTQYALKLATEATHYA